MNRKAEEFKISGADASFASRSKDLFTALEAISSKHEANEKFRKRTPEGDNLVKPDPVYDDFKTLEKCAFKSPKPQSSKSRPYQKMSNKKCIPDYKTNPTAWTKYDLSDVSEEDMSEKSNTAAALSFLTTRPVDVEGRNCDTEDSDIKCVFKKPKHGYSVEAKKKTYGSKLVMPEYVVGAKQRKGKKVKIYNDIAEGGVVELRHLDEVNDSIENDSSLKKTFVSCSKSNDRRFRKKSLDNDED